MRAIITILCLCVGALALTNPDEKRLREAMRAQDSLMLEAAALLPIERTNYRLASKFEIRYLIGSKTCWGAAWTVFVCPETQQSAKAR